MQNSSRKTQSLTADYPLTMMANFALLALALALVFIYVRGANMVTSQRYGVTQSQRQLADLQEKNGLLIAKKEALVDSGLLSEFAARNNMIEARGISYIFENKDVALANKEH